MKLWCLVVVALVGCAHVATPKETAELEVARAFSVSDSTGDLKTKQRSDFDLSQALHAAGLPFTTFIYTTPLVQAGPEHPFHLQGVTTLCEIQPELRDDYLIPSILNNNYAKFKDAWRALPAETQACVAYNLGRIARRKVKLDDAKNFLESIPSTSAFAARAQNELALALSDPRFVHASDDERIKNLETALRIFEEQHAVLEVARVNYDAGRTEEALRWYAKEPLFSEAWNRALFESVPDTIPTLACVFVRANASLPEFDKTYFPMADAITARNVESPKKNPFAFVELVTDPANTELPAPILRWLRSHRRVVDTVAMLEHENAEFRELPTRRPLQDARFSPEAVMYIGQNRQVFELVTAESIRGVLSQAAKAIAAFDEDVKKIQNGELKCR